MTNATRLQYPRAGFIGFDHLFNELERVHSKANSGYPPHNVIKESETEFTIQVAVAGFKESQIDIEVKDGFLNISGDSTEAEEDVVDYIHKGISSKRFSRTFRLSEHVEVTGAALQDGILVIHLEYVVPEELRPRKILINGGQLDHEGFST
jgi:molecular chaperone IbpA|tara:strand:- start:1070 stop:1522 length:453 start_codon:yes stop_codon:yes gene_type:complete